MTGEVALYYGTYLNKGGAAIAYGTLNALRQLGIYYRYIVDCEPFPETFFTSYKITPIYRYSEVLTSKKISSVSVINTFYPFVRCLVKSYSSQLKELRGLPIWHIGDSPFSDKRSQFSLIGQIVSLESLKRAIKSETVIFGGVSIDYPLTSVGKYLTQKYFKNYYFFARGKQTFDNLVKLGVRESDITIISDFAFQLGGTNRQHEIERRFSDSDKPIIALCLRDYSSGSSREDYIRNISKLISSLSPDFDVRFVPTSYSFLEQEDDYLFVKRVLGIADDSIINIRDYTPSQIIGLFSSFAGVVSSRLHGAVYGTLANVPTMHLYDSPKSIEVVGALFGDAIFLMKLSDFTQKTGFDAASLAMRSMIERNEEIAQKLSACIAKAKNDTVQTLKRTIQEKNLLGGV